MLRKSFKAASGWYYVSFPFDVTFGNIKVTSTQLTATTSSYKTATAPYKHFYVAEYNSARRDQTGNSISNDSQNWDAVIAGTLSAKKGYAIRVMADIEIDFVGTANADMFDTASKNTTLEINATNSSATHHNWNLVGLPYTSAFNLDNLSQGTFYYVYNHTTQTFDVIQNGNAYKLNSFGAFFVQASDPALTFNTAGRVLKAPSSSKSSYDEIQLSLSNAGFSDITSIRLSDDGNLDYELDKDAAKILSLNDSTPQIWTNGQNCDLAINSLPTTIHEVALNTKTIKGTYSIALNRPENITNTGKIILVDNCTGVQTDLLTESSYTFDCSTGVTSNRFKIIFQNDLSTKIPAIVNGISVIVSGENLIVNGLSESANIKLIDLTGRIVQTFEKVENNENLKMNPKQGIYLLHIQTATQESKLKILCK